MKKNERKRRKDGRAKSSRKADKTRTRKKKREKRRNILGQDKEIKTLRERGGKEEKEGEGERRKRKRKRGKITMQKKNQMNKRRNSKKCTKNQIKTLMDAEEQGKNDKMMEK